MVAYKYTKSTFIESGDELLHVTELDCSNCKITSFEGLNAPLLTALWCGGNKLTSFEHLNCPLLTRLHCYDNNLTSFEYLNCPLLATLHCSDNDQLTSLEHLNCPLLTRLLCYSNNLTSLEHLNCPLLTALYCCNNKLTSFEHLNCPLLTTLYCPNNNLTSFEHLNCPLLTTLYCCNNKLTSFEHLNCPLLTKLSCPNNKLTSFQHLNCPLLVRLYCSHTNLTSFEHLNCPLLTMLDCGENAWEFIPPHINRLLNTIKHTQNVYTDGQNVHNHHIQESIRSSIQAVISKKPSIVAADLYEAVLSDPVLTKETKEILMEYCKDSNVHSTLRITFEELLVHVFSRIESNEHKKEIKNMLNMEMTDSVCKCFTGRMSRLINCLNGFDDLVSIRISDTEQIGQVIGQIKEQLEAANEYTVEKHREMATNELLVREYSQEVIAEWIGFIE